MKNDENDENDEKIYKTPRDLYIIFDDNFKKFINDIKMNLDLRFLNWQNNHLDLIQNTQENIRDFIKNNFYKLNKTRFKI